MDALIDLAKSALRSVRMAVELIGVGGDDVKRSKPLFLAPGGWSEYFDDMETQERLERELARPWFTDADEVAMHDERWSNC